MYLLLVDPALCISGHFLIPWTHFRNKFRLFVLVTLYNLRHEFSNTNWAFAYSHSSQFSYKRTLHSCWLLQVLLLRVSARNTMNQKQHNMARMPLRLYLIYGKQMWCSTYISIYTCKTGYKVCAADDKLIIGNKGQIEITVSSYEL